MEREYTYEIDSDSGSYTLNEVIADWINCTNLLKHEKLWRKHKR